MPATSDKQRRAAGMAYAALSGKLSKSSLKGAAKGMAKSMTKAQAKEFATKVKKKK